MGSLAFDVCNITPFEGKRNLLFNTIADCLCDAALAMGSGVDRSYKADLERRRLQRGDNECDLKVVRFAMDTLSETLSDCNSDGVTLEFGVEGCGECDHLNDIVDGFSLISKEEAINQILTCANYAAKQAAGNDVGFEVFENGVFSSSLIDAAGICLDADTAPRNGLSAIYMVVTVIVFAFALN